MQLINDRLLLRTAIPFEAAITKLDHLVALGATATEIMPVGDFPGRRNWGYDGVLPYAPDSSYGRPEDLKMLVEAAHTRGLMVLLDVAYNHFGHRARTSTRPRRAFTDRHFATAEAVHAISAVYLLSPQIPMLFMGEEWDVAQPFPFFCDFGPELADAVRKGRRAEFACFPEFQDPAMRERIPDPMSDETFASANLDWADLRGRRILDGSIGTAGSWRCGTPRSCRGWLRSGRWAVRSA